jgi:mono/diheme cytochrome c family protein
MWMSAIFVISKESSFMSKLLQTFKVSRGFTVGALAAFAFLAAGTISQAQTTASGDAASTFKSKCAACHAADGSGSTLGKRLHAPDLRSKEVQGESSADLAKIISGGKNSMPAFGNKLDAQQIQQLVDYIRTLAAK